MEFSRAIGGHTVYAAANNSMKPVSNRPGNTSFTPECNRWHCGLMMRNTATSTDDYAVRAARQVINVAEFANWYLTGTGNY